MLKRDVKLQLTTSRQLLINKALDFVLMGRRCDGRRLRGMALCCTCRCQTVIVDDDVCFCVTIERVVYLDD